MSKNEAKAIEETTVEAPDPSETWSGARDISQTQKAPEIINQPP